MSKNVFAANLSFLELARRSVLSGDSEISSMRSKLNDIYKRCHLAVAVSFPTIFDVYCDLHERGVVANRDVAKFLKAAIDFIGLERQQRIETEKDGCATLKDDSMNQGPGKCKVIKDDCAESVTDIDGNSTCLTNQQEWSCATQIPLPPANAEWIREQTEIIENIDESACADLIAQGCSKGKISCTDDGCTRTFHCGGKSQSGCSALEAAGCTYTQTPECNASVDETCQVKVGEMKCEGDLPEGVVEAGDAEITDQTTVNVGMPKPDVSSCTEMTEQFQKEGMLCTQTSQICVDRYPTVRVINGRTYSAPCWGYERTYQCERTQPASTCDELAAEPKCKEISRNCQVQGDDGCSEEQVIYQCDGSDVVNAGEAELVDQYDKITELVHVNTCTEFEQKEICRKESEVCIEEGGTKIVNGSPVTKDCWRYEIKYVCGSGTPAVCEQYQ